jgi:hypothetical protein
VKRWVLLIAIVGGVAAVIVGLAAHSGGAVKTLLAEGAESASVLSEAPEEADDAWDTAQPSVNLDHPSKADWAFLGGVMSTGTAAAKRSASQILVEINQIPGAELLFGASAAGGADSDMFCLSALEILRVQQRADTIAAIWAALDRAEPAVSKRCRRELEDRSVLIGADDPRYVRPLWSHPNEDVRLHVVEVLGRTPEAYMDVLEQMAKSDLVAAVRERAASTLAE